jgi:hypothetical protein
MGGDTVFAYLSVGSNLYWSDGTKLYPAGQTPDGATIDRVSATGAGTTAFAYITAGSKLYWSDGTKLYPANQTP